MPTRKLAAVEPVPEDEPVVVDTVETVRLSPVPGAYIPGEPAAEREVTAEEAERLLSFSPPAYMVAPPPQPPTLSDAVAEPQE